MVYTIDEPEETLNPEKLLEKHKTQYQKKLTEKLDDLKGNLTQETINEMVLWKVNRYVEMEREELALLNSISPDAEILDKALTEKILLKLLAVSGVRLAMASTFLRFRNPNIYQIIDQRTYRYLYQETIKNWAAKEAVAIYLQYLDDLRAWCQTNDVSFQHADRIVYQADKKENKHLKLKY